MPGRPNLVYVLHIPKTAGMSLRAFLTRNVGPGELSEAVVWDHLVRHPEFIHARTRVVCGHFGGLLPVWLGRWPRTITLVREPVARALSHINHIQRVSQHPLHPHARGLSVAEYCRHPDLRRTVENFQARYLASLAFAEALAPDDPSALPDGSMSVGFENALYCLDAAGDLEAAARRGLDRMAAVGLTEQFPRSLRLFCRVLGWADDTPPPRENEAIDGQRTLASLTDDERHALAEVTRVDAAVYRAAAARFAADCGRLGVDAPPGSALTAA